MHKLNNENKLDNYITQTHTLHEEIDQFRARWACIATNEKDEEYTIKMVILDYTWGQKKLHWTVNSKKHEDTQ